MKRILLAAAALSSIFLLVFHAASSILKDEENENYDFKGEFVDKTDDDKHDDDGIG